MLKKLHAYQSETVDAKASVWRAVGTLGRTADGTFDVSRYVEKPSHEMKFGF